MNLKNIQKEKKNENEQTQTHVQQDLINKKNKTFAHLLNYKEIYLTSLYVIIYLIVILKNFFLHNPLLMGAESYYHLSIALHASASTFYYYPLQWIINSFPEQIFAVVPLILGIVTLHLFFKLATRIKLEEKITLFLPLFLILTPSFILTYVTLSSYSWLMFLLLNGTILIIKEKKSSKYISLIFFILATFVDVLSTAIILLLLGVLYLKSNQEEQKDKDKFGKKYLLFTIIIVTISAIINIILLKQPFILGPFHQQNLILDLISELGGIGGIGFSLLLLSLVGFGLSWKKKEYYWTYFLLTLLIVSYVFNTNIIFYLSIILSFFASIATIKIFERKWVLDSLKGITLMLVLLSILFSTISYLDWANQQLGPSSGDQKALTWIRGYTQPDKIVFSTLDNAYFVSYFARREVFLQPDENNELKERWYQHLLESTYIDVSFPILEGNEIKLVYINPKTRNKFPAEQGLLFLLSNERFKLLYSQEGYEVWLFL